MQTVSDSFKKAIKSDNREIYGYVDVIYDKKSGDYYVDSIPDISLLSKPDGMDIMDDIKVIKNYATLENNYFLLNGEFILPNTNVLHDAGGYISDETFADIINESMEDDGCKINIIANNSGYITTKGFSIFFKDNIPFDFNINITTEYGQTTEQNQVMTIEVRNNTKFNYQYIFDNETTIKEFELIIYNTEYIDRRIRISDISFSLTDLYMGEELINFDVNEEIDLLVESLPINTCSVSLNNYPDENGNIKFDPINPGGITQYLTDNTTLIPYIGVLTEENGIEYVKMGEFYLKNWSSNANGNVTLQGEDLISKLKNMDIKSDGTFLNTIRTWGELSTYLTNMTGYTIVLGTGGSSNEKQLKEYNFGNWLLGNLPFLVVDSGGNPYIFYISRNNEFLKRRLYMNRALDNISKKELVNDVVYKTKTTINKVEIVDIVFTTEGSSGREDVIKDSHTLLHTEEYVWYKPSSSVYFGNSTFSYTNNGHGSATLVDKNNHMIYVKYQGNVGDVVNITYNGEKLGADDSKTITFTNNKPVGESLSIDFTKYFKGNDSFTPTIANYYLTKDMNYIVTASTMGDPSLVVGDTIAIQTRYDNENDGYKNIVLTKQKFTFDGGLRCELEGRGN